MHKVPTLVILSLRHHGLSRKLKGTTHSISPFNWSHANSITQLLPLSSFFLLTLLYISSSTLLLPFFCFHQFQINLLLQSITLFYPWWLWFKTKCWSFCCICHHLTRFSAKRAQNVYFKRMWTLEGKYTIAVK